MSMSLDITGQLIVDYRAREWCKLPYPGHPKGCPNFGHKATCPPQVCCIEGFIDLGKPMWLVVEAFDLRGHMDRMKATHPTWSNRQARCVLYWQASVNKRLQEACSVQAQHENGVYTVCPEAMGVNVILTAKQLGLPVHNRPRDVVFKIGLVGSSTTAKEKTA